MVLSLNALLPIVVTVFPSSKCDGITTSVSVPLYFVILAVFTAVLFIMFFFTFIAGIELEYISKNFDFKSLFAFKQLVYKYSSAKLARFTAVSVAQFALILLIFEFAKKGISLLIYTLALFLIILMVLGFNWILENYKFNVYNSDL